MDMAIRAAWGYKAKIKGIQLLKVTPLERPGARSSFRKLL